MPKVDPTTLKEFGQAVKRERARRGIGQAAVGGMVKPPVGNSLISKIEKGRKEALDAVTVGRIVAALGMDESWIDKFIDAEETPESGETKAEREADQVIDRLRREGLTEGASDDLLIQLANNFTAGDHKDRETAYLSVRSALEELAKNREIAALAGNADAQFAALMQQVDQLNQEGEFDAAAQLLDDEGTRIERLTELHLQKQINQDRLRNRPEKAAKRLIADLHRQAPAGGVFWATDRLLHSWQENGDHAGDIFTLQVALELAKINHQKAKGKKAFEARALYALGWSHLRLAERSTKPGHLKVARNAFDAALKKTNMAKDPLVWSALKDGLGMTLLEMGERANDPEILQEAVTALRAALAVAITEQNEALKYRWNNLGGALQKLGEVTHSAEILQEAEDALSTALALKDKSTDPIDWGVTQNNLALTQRWLGEITVDLTKLDQARTGYADCEALNIKEDAPFQWAILQWNIADLALARFRLDPDPAHLVEARNYLAKARAVFVEGSDYQTRRCDDLLAEIDAAEAA